MQVNLGQTILAFAAGLLVASAFDVTPRNAVTSLAKGGAQAVAHWRAEASSVSEPETDAPFKGKPPRPALKPSASDGV